MYAIRLEDIRPACRGAIENILMRQVLKSRAWVMEVAHFVEGRPAKKRWVRCTKIYEESNSVGSRGIYKLFILEPRVLYWVSDPRSWSRTERYFCVVDGFDLTKLTKEEAVEWAKKNISE